MFDRVHVLPACTRSHLFRPYWAGRTVSPRAYLKGTIILWLSLELGGILSMAGCSITHSLLPNLLPAMAAFILFALLWPAGTPMVCPNRGNLDDPERYVEPR